MDLFPVQNTSLLFPAPFKNLFNKDQQLIAIYTEINLNPFLEIPIINYKFLF